MTVEDLIKELQKQDPKAKVGTYVDISEDGGAVSSVQVGESNLYYKGDSISSYMKGYDEDSIVMIIAK